MKYRLTYEIVVEVEAENIDEAIEKGDEEWSKGNFELIPSMIKEF